ncbi:MAG: amino acid permease [Cyanothece sp. SIO1E1]|nr:amino acid permease [Cyanothece sp. SIO1E1]
MEKQASSRLKQELGVGDAILLGLGSMIGTGVFVSIGIAAGVAGPSVILAITIAGLLATCNGLNSAQLAANHAVSGGTYEYGYKYLKPWLGFIAGWMFLLAKTASAATAALGFAGYLLNALGRTGQGLLIPLALVAVATFSGIILAGVRRSQTANLVIVSITLLALAIFVLVGLPVAFLRGAETLVPFFGTAEESSLSPLAALLQASALMFVAYTGYGRIATMGEEVKRPRTTIPQAIIATMGITLLIYVVVAIAAIGALGAPSLVRATWQQAAPLEIAARSFDIPGIAPLVGIGAITAMLGVLLNLILGLSRVLLAMARRRDMPSKLARLNRTRTTPTLAVATAGGAIAMLIFLGDVRTTWSFSAFTVLVYYALTNLAALRLSETERLYPKWLAWVGLIACLFLSLWVERRILIVGIVLIVIGLIWHAIAQGLGARLARRLPRN